MSEEFGIVGDPAVSPEEPAAKATLTFAHPYTQKHIKVGGDRLKEPISIYYEVHGTGKKRALLVMGLNSTCRNWDYQAEHFGAGSEYSVLIYDNRGVGWSDSPPWGYGTSDMAFDVIELLEHIGWIKDVHLVGISMGGMIAQKLILERPDIFTSLVLAATTAGNGIPFQWSGASTLLGNMRIKDPDQIARRLAYVNYTQHWLESSAENSQHGTNLDSIIALNLRRGKLIPPQPLQGIIGHIYAAVRHYVSATQLDTIRTSGVPVMVVVGSEDKLIATSNSHYLKDALAAKRFEIFEDTGHALQTQRYKQFNKFLEEFWAESEEA